MTAVGDLLVRRLVDWAPASVQRSRRAVFLCASPDEGTATAAMRALSGLDLGRGRELSMVAIGAAPAVAATGGLTVHALAGAVDALVGPAMVAAGATGVPVLGFFEGSPPAPATVAALTAGKPAEVLLALESVERYRAAWPLFGAVAPVGGVTMACGTTSGKSLEAFKDLAATGPADDLPGLLLTHLGAVGATSVTELRTFTLTGTPHRAADATEALRALLDAGTLSRDPADGRLGGDVRVRLAARKG